MIVRRRYPLLPARVCSPMRLLQHQASTADGVRAGAARAAVHAGLLGGVALGLGLLLTQNPAQGADHRPLEAGRVAAATVTATGTTTMTATITPTAAAGATMTPTVTVTPTVIVSPTLTATITPTLVATPTLTATAPPPTSVTPSATPSQTPDAHGHIYLPYAAQGDSLAKPRPRTWGMQFQLEFLPERHRENVAIELPRARIAGLRSVRTNVRWDEIEPVNSLTSAFDWAVPDRHIGDYSAAGFDVLVTLVGYPLWASRYACGGGLHAGMETEWRAFVRAAATRYSRPPYNVAAWEIGNEVDGETRVRDDDWDRPDEWGRGQPTTPYGGCWGDVPEEYAGFLKAAYEEIKAVEPAATVTYGGLAYQDWEGAFNMDFIDRLLRAGGGQWIDVHNYHSFAHFWDRDDQPTGVEKHISFMERLSRGGEPPKPVWLTETYQLTWDHDPATAGLQVRFLTRALVELLAFPELERVYWYGYTDIPDDISDGPVIGRGIIWPDRTPKPAFAVLPFTIAYTNGVPRDISTPEMAAYAFEWPRSGRRTIIAWSRGGEPGQLRVQAPAGGLATAMRFPAPEVLAGVCCDRQVLAANGGSATVTVAGDAVFIAEEPAR